MQCKQVFAGIDHGVRAEFGVQGSNEIEGRPHIAGKGNRSGRVENLNLQGVGLSTDLAHAPLEIQREAKAGIGNQKADVRCRAS
jgi:hypothetical protein